MASTVNGVRLVRCPKCLKVLTEFAEVPVYKCGGCGTTLRAKNLVTAQEIRASGSLGNNSQNLSGSSSSNSGSTSLVNQPITCSSQVDDEAEKAAPSNLHVSDSNAASNCNGKGESSEHGENGIEERVSDSPKPADQFVLGRSDTYIIAESQPEESMQVKREDCLNEEMEKSLKLSPQNNDSSKSNDKMEESSESIGHDATYSEEDMRLTTRSSHAYDGSVSSTDEGRQGRVPQKYLLLSKRTFRRKKILDSTDSIEKEAQPQGQNLPAESSNERHASAIKVSSDSNRDELPSKPCIHASERDTTFSSEDFHSVQNWMDTENDRGPSRSLSKDPLYHGDSLNPQNGNKATQLNYLEPDHMKILRKVDELRDELSGFLTKTVEGKGASHFKHRLAPIPLSGQPSCSGLACTHNICCHSNIPSCLHKAQTQDAEAEKLHCKEKKQPMKRYCRPVYGGAPFVICYKCWTLLQLPADFLVTRKRLHKLQCGACSEVLVFSFRPRVRTAPQTPTEVQHPPSEVDNNNDCAGGDPISFSEDYGLSFAKSYSSEAEPVLNVSRNSSYSMKERDGKQVGGLRLHRLMGYSSASELLFHTGGVDEGYQSTEPSTPQFYRPSEDYDMGYRLNGTGLSTPKSMEIQEEEESHERLRTRRRGLALHGLLKKGVRELSHGFESVKLKVHSNG